MKPLFFLTLASLLTAPAFAGDKVLNGGDLCEKRIQDVRDDIRGWIRAGGAAALKLPAGVSLAKYVSSMEKQFAEAEVSCGDETLRIGSSEKTCVNYVDAAGKSRIECDAEKFLATPEEGQYVLVHHEYAGLAGLEVNDGERSRYEISNQLSASLEEQTVKRLYVRNPADPYDRLKRYFGEFLGTYEMIDCSVSSDRKKEAPKERPGACKAKTVTLVLSDRFLEKSGYRTVDAAFGEIPGFDEAYHVAFANDSELTKLSKGFSYSPPRDEKHAALETSVRELAGKVFIQWNRVDTKTGEFERFTVVARRK